MNEDPEQKSALSAIILVAIIIVVAIYSTTFGLQTLAWINAHRWGSDEPWLKQTPQPVAATADSAANTPPAPAPVAVSMKAGKSKAANASDGPQVADAYGYQFTVPWTSKMKESPSAGGAEFRFDAGQIVIFGDPEAQLDTLHILRDTPTSQYASYEPLFSDGSIATNYDLYSAVYHVSPSQISPLMNYNVAQRDRVLLLTKLSFGYDLAKPMYSFDFGAIKGFQFGDPASGPVAIRAFNSHGKQFRFIFAVFTGTSGEIAQSDINQAMQSLQNVTPASPDTK